MRSLMHQLVKIAIDQVNHEGGHVRVHDEHTGEQVKISMNDNKLFLTVESD